MGLALVDQKFLSKNLIIALLYLSYGGARWPGG